MPINTVETDKAIAAQQEAAQPLREDTIASPGALPVPQIPRIDPSQYGGDGRQTGGTAGTDIVPGTNVDSDFMNKVLGTKDKAWGPGRLPSYTVEEVSTPRYKNFLPGENEEEVYSQTQSSASKWGHALVKFAATTVGTFYNSLVSIPTTIENAGKKELAWESPGGQQIDTWLKNLEDEFPNYYSKWEQAHPFLSALPLSGGFANFWGDKMLKNFGFTVGAIAGSALQDLVIGAATGGIGEIPGVAAQFGKYALKLQSIFTEEKALLRLAETGERLGSSLASIEKAQNLLGAAHWGKITDGIRYATNLYGSAASEAGVEARDGFNTVKKDLLTAYQNKNGYDAFGEDLEEINKAATASANARFGINMVLLGVSNAVQWDSFLKPFSTARKGATSSLEKELEGVGKIGLKEGSIDSFEQKLAKTRLGRFAAASRPYLADVLSEGVYEEGGQYAAQVGTANYYERKYASRFKDRSGYTSDEDQWDARSQLNNVLHSTVQGLGAEFGTSEGLENIFLGGLTGVMSKGIKAISDRAKGIDSSVERNSVISFLNSQGVTGMLQNHYTEAGSAIRVANDMKEAVKRNDIFQYKNLQHEQYVRFITSGMKAGRFDVRMAQLDLLKGMTDEKFQEAWGMDKTGDNLKTVNQYVDQLKIKAQDIKRNYELMNKTFANPFARVTPRKNGTLTEQEQQNNIDHNTFEDMKDDMVWVSSIQKDANERQAKIEHSVGEIDSRISPALLAMATNGKKLNNYSKRLSDSATVIRSQAEAFREASTAIDSQDRTANQEAIKDADRMEELASRIDSALKNKKLSGEEYGRLFTDIMNEDITKGDPEITGIPAQAVPQLMEYGRDHNRLTTYKRDAKDKFEAMVTNKGFQNYFDDVDKSQKQYKHQAGLYGQVPGQPRIVNDVSPLNGGTDDNNLTNSTDDRTKMASSGVPKGTVQATPPVDDAVKAGDEVGADGITKSEVVPPRNIVIRTKDGKVSKTFKEGQYYDVKRPATTEGDIAKPEEWVSAKILSHDVAKDEVTVEDKDGETWKLSVEELFEKDPEAQAEEDFQEKMNADNPPDFNEKDRPDPEIAEANDNIDETAIAGEGAKKDLRQASRTSTSPEYHRVDTEYNMFQKREQDYVFNMDSTDPAIFNQENKEKLAAMYVNRQQAILMGLPSDFVSDKEDGDVPTLRIIHVVGGDKVGEVYFAKPNGDRGTRVEPGAKPNPNEILFTNAPTADMQLRTKDEAGNPIPGKLEARYTNKDNLDVDKVQEEWITRRKELMSDAKMPEAWGFKVSNGFKNKGAGNRDFDFATRTPVVESNIVTQADLDNKDVISVSTTSTVSPSNANGIEAISTNINVKEGRYMLNSGTNVTYLNSRTFTPEEVDKMYETMKFLARKSGTTEEWNARKDFEKPKMWRMLKGMILLRGGPDLGAGSKSSLTISGRRIFLGNSNTYIDNSEPGVIANEKRIKDFLSGAWHNVDNVLLQAKKGDRPYTEYKEENDKAVAVRTWPSYQHYLLDQNTPDGKKREGADLPLTVNVSIREGEVPIIGKYILMDDPRLDSSKYVVDPKLAADNVEVIKPQADISEQERRDVRFEITGIEKERDAQIRKQQDNITASIKYYKTSDEGSPLVRWDTTASGKHQQWIMNEHDEWTKVGDRLIARATPQEQLSDPVLTRTGTQEEIDAENEGKDDIYAAVDKIKAEAQAKLEPLYEKIKEKPPEVKKPRDTDNRNPAAKPRQEGNKASQAKPGASSTSSTTPTSGTKSVQTAAIETKAKVVSDQDMLNAIKNKTDGVTPFRINFKDTAGNPQSTILRTGDYVYSPEGRLINVKVVGVQDAEGNFTAPANDLASEMLSKIIMNEANKDFNPPPPPPPNSTKENPFKKAKKDGTKPSAGDQNRTVTMMGDYEKIDIDKEFKRFKKMLGDVRTLKKVDQILQKTGGGQAWGAVNNAFLTIWDKAERGTIYHEAFEVVFNNYLDRNEQDDLFDEFTQRSGSFRTFENKTKTYRSATTEEAKEELAEEFRNYLIDRENNRSTLIGKIKQFFNDIYNFIKRVIFRQGEPDSLAMFRRMNQGYYRNMPSNVRDVDGPENYRSVGLQGESEATIQDMLQGMTIRMFQQMFKEKSDLIQQLETNPTQTAGQLYDKLRENLRYYYTGNGNGCLFNMMYAQQLSKERQIGRELSDDEAEIELKKYQHYVAEFERLDAKWPAFVKEHYSYLKTFSIEFKKDVENQLNLAELQSTADDNNGQSDYARDVMLLDAKKSSSLLVKLFIAGISDSTWMDTATALSMDISSDQATRMVVDKFTSSTVGLPKQAPYAKLFNYMLSSAANRTGGLFGIVKHWNEIVQDVKRRKDVDANLQRVLTRLEFDEGFKNKPWAAVKFLLAFENTFTKIAPGFGRQFQNRKGEVTISDTELNSKTNQVQQEWANAILGSGLVKPQSEGATNFQVIPLKDFKLHFPSLGKDSTKFLNAIGIQISTEEYNRLRGTVKNDFNTAASGIYRTLEIAAKDRKFFTSTTGSNLDIKERFKALSQIYVSFISGDNAQGQHPNLDDEQTQSYVQGNFVSTILNDAAAAKGVGEGEDRKTAKQVFEDMLDNSYLKDLFHKDSVMLNNLLFDKDGKATENVEFMLVEGLATWNGKNNSTSSMVAAQRLIYEINNNLNGIFYTLLPADAKSEYAVKTGGFIDRGDYLRDPDAAKKQFSDQMRKWLRTEVDLARDYKTNPNRSNVKELGGKWSNKEDKETARTKGQSLRFFGDFLPQDKVNLLHKLIDSDTDITETAINDIISHAQFETVMMDNIEAKMNATMNFLKDNSLFGNGANKNVTDGKIYATYLDAKVLKEIDDKNKTRRYSEESIKNIMRLREMNYMVNAIDMHKMFFGDPAQYKDELKRIKSFLSGREATHTDTLTNSPIADQGFNSWANENMNKVGNDGTNHQVAINRGTPGYQNHKNYFNTFTLRDIFTNSKNGDNRYTGIEEADGTSWLMPEAYREIMMKAGGRWTDAQEKQYQRMMAHTRQMMVEDGVVDELDMYPTNKYGGDLRLADEALVNEEKDPKATYQTLKLVHSGMQTVGDVAVASMDKSSWSMLSYPWFRERNLGKLYVELQKKEVDYVRVESAHKVGIQNKSLTPMYDDEGKLNVEGIRAMELEEVSLKHLGVQVEQATKEKGQTESSQLRKLISLDFMKGGVPIDYKGTVEQWDELSERDQLKQSPIFRKITRVHAAIEQSIRKRTDIKLKKMGFEKDQEGNYNLVDKKKVSDFIKREILRRELPQNIAEGLEMRLVEEGVWDFRTPLEGNAQYAKIRQIVYSTITNSIQRPKFSGGQKTLVTVAGMERDARIKVGKDSKGNPVYMADTLKFYEYKEGDKVIKACEVMLPYYFYKKMKASGSKRTKEEVLHHLQNTAEGKELLRGMGFRIPVQGMNSIDFFRVVDFLDEGMGDAIVFPSEITKKAGSDFDIDKMNVYLRNFYVDKETGLPRISKYFNTKTANEEQLRSFYETQILPAHEEYKAAVAMAETKRAEKEENLIKSQMRAGHTFMKDGQEYSMGNIDMSDEEEDDLSEEPDWVPTFDEWKAIIKSDKSQPWEWNTKEAIENEYMDAFEDLAQDPMNYENLIKPNDASYLKGLRDTMVKLLGTQNDSDNQTGNRYGRLLDSVFMMKERQAYISSKKVVAIAAVANTFHALCQLVPNGFWYDGEKRFRIKTEVNHIETGKKKGSINLGGQLVNAPKYKGRSLYISEILSQFIDLGVDVVKDKALAELGINQDNLAVTAALIRAGADPEWVVRMINQPLVKQYMEERNLRKSLGGKTKGIGAWYGAQRYRKGILKNARWSKYDDKVYKEGHPDNWSKADLEGMLGKRPEDMTDLQRAHQQILLDDYISYEDMGWDLFNTLQGFNWDTNNMGDPNFLRLKGILYARANMGKKINAVGELMRASFLGPMRESILTMDKNYQQIFRIQNDDSPAGQAMQKQIKKMSKSRLIPSSQIPTYAMRRENAMLDHSVFNSTMPDGTPMAAHFNRLFFGKESLANYIQQIKKLGRVNQQDQVGKEINVAMQQVANDPFIDNLDVTIDPDNRQGFPNIVFMKDREYDTTTANNWTDSVRRLSLDNTIVTLDHDVENNTAKTVGQIMNDLVMYSAIHPGQSRNSGSFMHLMPNELLDVYTRPGTETIRIGNYLEVNAFERNNWNDDNVVPTMQDFYFQDQAAADSVNHDFEKPYIWPGEVKGMVDLIKSWKNPDFVMPRIIRPYLFQTKGNLKTPTEFIKIKGEEGPVMLFRLVKNTNGGPLSTDTTTKHPNGIYVQINAWGDGDIKEYYNNIRPSQLSSNARVSEISDDDIIRAYSRLGAKINEEDNVVALMINSDLTLAEMLDKEYVPGVTEEDDPTEELVSAVDDQGNSQDGPISKAELLLNEADAEPNIETTPPDQAPTDQKSVEPDEDIDKPCKP